MNSDTYMSYSTFIMSHFSLSLKSHQHIYTYTPFINISNFIQLPLNVHTRNHLPGSRTAIQSCPTLAERWWLSSSERSTPAEWHRTPWPSCTGERQWWPSLCPNHWGESRGCQTLSQTTRSERLASPCSPHWNKQTVFIYLFNDALETVGIYLTMHSKQFLFI